MVMKFALLKLSYNTFPTRAVARIEKHRGGPPGGKFRSQPSDIVQGPSDTFVSGKFNHHYTACGRSDVPRTQILSRREATKSSRGGKVEYLHLRIKLVGLGLAFDTLSPPGWIVMPSMASVR